VKTFRKIVAVFIMLMIFNMCKNMIMSQIKKSSNEPANTNSEKVLKTDVSNFNDIIYYHPKAETQKIIIDTAVFKYNKNSTERDEILNLKINWKKEKSGIAYFENLSVMTLETLLIQKFIDPNDCQNSAPSVKDIFNFMCKYPQMTTSGYAISPLREDYRISIDGLFVSKELVTPQLKKDFIEFCKDADEIEIDSDLVSWWD